jgi:hypothetical protein
MKLQEITLKNIKSFIQGHARAYLDKIRLLPLHTREQAFYRMYVCRDTCIPFGKCEICQCPAIKKSYATKSCNIDKFPDLMSEIEWRQYKLDNNIDESVISAVLAEVDAIFYKPNK